MNQGNSNSDSIQKIFEILEADRVLNPKLNFSYNYETKFLKLSGLTKFPEIYDFGAEIEILDISNGQLTELPLDFKAFKALKVCFLSFNDFTSLPDVLGQLPNLEIIGARSCKITTIPDQSLPKKLRWLTLTDNLIEKLPSAIGQCTNLQKLLLAGNQLTDLPETISNCKKLALLRISANKFSASPLRLLAKLPTLAWYSDAGNPHSYEPNLNQFKPESFSWNDLKLGEKIGESAQNQVYNAEILSTGQVVAVKIYGNQITSDGYPADEIKINLAIGDQPAVIKTIGEIKAAPNHQKALIMQLIQPDFKKLGLPPNFETCYRDTFTNEAKFSLDFISKLLFEVSHTCAMLQTKGITHGDLYAHNILVNQAGQIFLADFGAASFSTQPESTIKASIEVAAFGYLITDLLAHCETIATLKYQALNQIADQCLNHIPQNRPSFATLSRMLGSLQT